MKLLEMFDWMECKCIDFMLNCIFKLCHICSDLKPFCKDLFFFPRFCRSTGNVINEIETTVDLVIFKTLSFH